MNNFLDYLWAHHVPLILAWVFSAAINSMPAPTMSSSPAYIFFFKFLNTLAANPFRAHSTTIEASPNFEAAVRDRIATLKNAGQL